MTASPSTTARRRARRFPLSRDELLLLAYMLLTACNGLIVGIMIGRAS